MHDVTLTVEDQLAIAQLYAHQSQAIDTGDGRAWAACFAKDGVFDSPTYPAPVQGQAALAAFADAFAVAAERDGVVRRHWTGTPALAPQGRDRVASRCYALVLSTAGTEPPRIERAVVFEDQLVRERGRWVMARRDVRTDARGGGEGLTEDERDG